MQTVVFTLIPWILDQVEDDKRGCGVIIPLPIVIPAPYQVRGKLQRESRVAKEYIAFIVTILDV